MRCKRKGCEQAGAWSPTLLVYLAGHDDLDLPPVGLGLVALPICSDHRLTTTSDQIVRALTWDQIETRIASVVGVVAQAVVLDRNRADLRWERVQ